MGLFLFVVGVVMIALGLAALIGANSSVERATRYADEQATEAARWKAAYFDATTHSNVRSLRESSSFGRVADLLAASEARRMDPDILDWSQPAEWRGRS